MMQYFITHKHGTKVSAMLTVEMITIQLSADIVHAQCQGWHSCVRIHGGMPKAIHCCGFKAAKKCKTSRTECNTAKTS